MIRVQKRMFKREVQNTCTNYRAILTSGILATPWLRLYFHACIIYFTVIRVYSHVLFTSSFLQRNGQWDEIERKGST